MFDSSIISDLLILLFPVTSIVSILNNGDNKIIIKVKAEDGVTEKEYILNVKKNKVLSDDYYRILKEDLDNVISYSVTLKQVVQRMRELAVQASNDTNTTSDREEIQKEIESKAVQEKTSNKFTDGGDSGDIILLFHFKYFYFKYFLPLII